MHAFIRYVCITGEHANIRIWHIALKAFVHFEQTVIKYESEFYPIQVFFDVISLSGLN